MKLLKITYQIVMLPVSLIAGICILLSACMTALASLINVAFVKMEAAFNHHRKLRPYPSDAEKAKAAKLDADVEALIQKAREELQIRIKQMPHTAALEESLEALAKERLVIEEDQKTIDRMIANGTEGYHVSESGTLQKCNFKHPALKNAWKRLNGEKD